jgi:DNA polymerase-3 subunit delta'
MDGFPEIIGHKKNIDYLKKVVALDKIKHAYIFSGPEGVGKYKTALALAYGLIGKYDANSSGLLSQNNHPDLLIIERDEGKNRLGKDKITKGLESWLALKPYSSKFRLVIIRDAHLMTLEAANALLKTLEEPPDYAVIILVIDNNYVLETLLSRGQIIKFMPLSDLEVKTFLQQRGIEEDKAEQAARLAQGSFSKAVKFADSSGFATGCELICDSLVKLINGKRTEIFVLAENMDKDPELFTSMIELILRDICVYSLTYNPNNLSMIKRTDLFAVIKPEHNSAIIKLLPEIAELKKNYLLNVNPVIININIAFIVWKIFN